MTTTDLNEVALSQTEQDTQRDSPPSTRRQTDRQTDANQPSMFTNPMRLQDQDEV